MTAFTKVPFPARAVLTVSAPVLVREMVVTVTLGIEKVPVRVWMLDSKVCTPLPPMNVGVLVMPPRKLTVEFIELSQVAPAPIVTNPVKIFVSVAEEKARMPLDPPPTVVVPVTVKLTAPFVNAVPLPTLRLPPTVSPVPVAMDAVSLRVTLPVTLVSALKVAEAELLTIRLAPTFVTPAMVFAPLVERTRFW